MCEQLHQMHTHTDTHPVRVCVCVWWLWQWQRYTYDSIKNASISDIFWQTQARMQILLLLSFNQTHPIELND